MDVNFCNSVALIPALRLPVTASAKPDEPQLESTERVSSGKIAAQAGVFRLTRRKARCGRLWAQSLGSTGPPKRVALRMGSYCAGTKPVSSPQKVFLDFSIRHCSGAGLANVMCRPRKLGLSHQASGQEHQPVHRTNHTCNILWHHCAVCLQDIPFQAPLAEKRAGTRDEVRASLHWLQRLEHCHGWHLYVRYIHAILIRSGMPGRKHAFG